jgi:hypothetical protein
MTKADQMRQNSEDCLDLAAEAASLAERLRYLRMAHAWGALADCQAWFETDAQPCSELEAAHRH